MSSVLHAVFDPPRPVAFRLPAVALFASGYVGLVLFGQWLALNPGHTVSVVLTSGLYLAVLLSSERGCWLKWAATVFAVECFVVMVIFREGAGEASIDAVSHASGAYAAAHVIRYWRGLPFQLNALPDVLVFSAATVLAGPLASIAAHGVLSAAAGLPVPGQDWLLYWTGDAAGAMVMAPLLLVLRQHAGAWRGVRRAQWLEAAALFMVLGLVLQVIFSNRLPTVYLALPLILWAAVRLGALGITLAMLVITLFIVRYGALGLGPYGTLPHVQALLAQSFLTVASVSALCLSAIIYQHRQTQVALRRARDELEQRVAQRTTSLAESERRLRESNAQFAVARAAARMIIIEWHIATDTLKYSDNPAWLRGPLPADGKYPPFSAQVHPGDLERFLEMRQWAIDTLQGSAVDFRIVRTDGIVLWVQSHQTIFAGPDGKAERLVSATQDISARKQIEASMRESEQRWRALLDGIPDRAWLKDAEGRFIAVNRAQEESYDLPAAKLIGKTIFDIRPDAVADRIAAEDRMVMGKGTSMHFERRSHLNNSWVEITKTPIFGADGKPAGIVAIWRDITVRKAAEQQALMQSEQRYRTLVNATAQAIWILDAQGRLNAIIKSITGNELDYVQSREWLDFVHEEDRAGAAAAMQAAIDTKSVYEHEHRIMDRNGRTWDVLARAVPVLNEDGSVREWIGTSMDVSRRKTAERALHGLNQTLRRLTGRREAVREEERARIAQNLHDGAGQSLNVVRLKLAAITYGLAQSAGKDAQAAQLAEVQGIIDQINQEIRSLEFELSPPVLRQLGLVPAIGWLGEEMQRSYGLKVLINDDDSDQKPLDQTRRASLFRAVRELLINVAKHAKVNTAHVDVQWSAHDIQITVSDMGKGFDTAALDQLEISGLGLAGVRERTEFSGGGMQVSSVPGAGTAITISMPLNEEAP
jgi:PAS domain S-box-containing protein